MFANDDYQMADPVSLRLQWLWHNLTMDQSAKVSVSLYGYRESTNTPELVYIDTLLVRTVDGMHGLWVGWGRTVDGSRRASDVPQLGTRGRRWKGVGQIAA